MQWEEFRYNIRHLSDADQAVVERAFRMGSDAHAGQLRKSGEPYFTHPIAVAHILADLGGDRDTVIAGLLHDTVEDTTITLSIIESAFGPTVATLIDGVTKLEHVDVADTPGLDEQIETLRKMFTLMQEDVRIMVIKLADRMHNMQTIGFVPLEKQIRVARETMDVYVKIADRLCMRDLQSTLESLCLAVLEPELHMELQHLRTSREGKGQQIVHTITHTLREHHTDAFGDATVHHEQKSWYRLREQLKTHDNRTTGVATIAVAIIGKDVDQCYRILGALHQEWQREILSFQDFVNSPMINGYRGVHTTVILRDGTRVRCKIRTEEMERYAHRGVTLFCFDNEAKGALEYLPWTQRIATIATDTSNRSREFWDGLQSDILGSTIVVHGPDDRTVMLPINATALDAAFYLFSEVALRVTHLYINGVQTAFDEPLLHAATISATFAPLPKANLRWLHSVNTAVASAMIRRHLSLAPLAEKIAVGRELFDIALQRFLRLRFDEIDPSLFLSRLQRLGMQDPTELFEDLAEGKVDPGDVAGQLFSDFRKQGRSSSAVSSWILRASVPSPLEERVIRTARTHPTLRVATEQVGDRTNITMRLSVNQQQADALDSALSAFLPAKSWSIRRTTSTRALIAGVVVLLMLWGLDPVVARYLLTNGISPYDLTFIRAVTFFIASSTLYSGQLIFFGRRLKWLSPTHPTLIFSGITLFVTALLSYLALAGVSATTYILCIIGGLMFTTLFHELLSQKAWHHTGIGLLTIAGGILLAAMTLGYTDHALFAGTGAGLGFALYSELSRRYQREGAAIRARYPAFLFWMSCVGIVLAGFLFPLTHFQTMSAWHMASAVAFVLLFSVLPYSLYFEITRRMESAFVDRSLPLVAIVALLGELLLSSSIAPLIILPVLLFFLVHYYGLYQRLTVTS